MVCEVDARSGAAARIIARVDRRPARLNEMDNSFVCFTFHQKKIV